MGQNARKIDLDAAAAARQEATGQHVEVTWKGHDYVLPIEQPMDVGRHFNKLSRYSDSDPSELPDGATVDAQGRPVLTVDVLDQIQNDGLSVLFCDEHDLPMPDDDHPGAAALHSADCQWRRFLASRPTREDRNELIAALSQAYGSTQGEARGPRKSSTTGGARSRQTGRAKAGTSGTSGAGAATKKAAAKPR